MRNILKQIAILLFFFFITLAFFRGLVNSPGAIMGGDWGFPITSLQIDKVFKDSMVTWADQGTLFGARNAFFAAIPFQWLIKLLSTIGMSSEVYYKVYLFFLFTFAAFSMYKLVRFLELSEFASILAGLFYITSPIFFNYSIMGWTYVLFALGLFPLATKYFIKAVAERKTNYVIFTGILYALSVIQSQSLLWFMIIFVFLGLHLVKDKSSLFSFIKNIIAILLLVFLLNTYWILGLLIFPDKQTFGSDIVKSTVSLGSVYNLQPINIIRLWGGLANLQYEKAINQSPFLIILSFLIPILSLSAIFLHPKRKLIVSFLLIGMVPFMMMLLNNFRDLLLYLPFSNGIRDFARFTTLSTFAYAVLAAFSLNYLLENKKKILVLVVVLLWFISIYPWWSADITNWNPAKNCDIRFKTKIFSKEYLELEKNFVKKRLDQKALYWPIGGIVAFTDDEKFQGLCNDTWDIFAGFSPIPGGLGMSDRSLGYIGEYVRAIKDNLDANLREIFYPANINYFVDRKNLLKIEMKSFSRKLEKMADEGRLERYIDNKKIAVYTALNFLPHFYTPQSIIIGNKVVDDLPQIVSQPDYKLRSAIYFNNQIKVMEDLPKEIKNTPVLEFRPITTAKYRIRVHEAKDVFPLVFSESFHEGWKAYLAKPSNFKFQISNFKSNSNDKISNYKILDGNEEDQATKEELTEFIGKGWISSLGEEKNIDFVSKNFQDTIQNDNLSNGKFYETWFKIPLDEKNHLVVNGYANSWIIDTAKICADSGKCIKNPDGSYNFELVVEFWPQRLFYIGGVISLITLISVLGYLTFIKLRGIVLTE